MREEPRRKRPAVGDAGGDVEHDLFLLVDRRFNDVAIKNQEHRHRGVADTFVAVDKRMVCDDGEADRCRFISQRRMQIAQSKGGSGLCKGRFEQTEVANAGRTTRLSEDLFVEFDDLTTVR